MNFINFKSAVASKFAEMSQYPLFRTNVNGYDLWNTYLESFHPGTNPIYRERTEHDCNCCKQFICTIGNVVALIDGDMISIWDVALDDQYQVVADALSRKVKRASISNIFLHDQATVGTAKNFEQLLNGESRAWEHFAVHVPSKFVKPSHSLDSELGKARNNYNVFKRALEELQPDTINTVIELIEQDSIYRGAEHLGLVREFLGVAIGLINSPYSLENFAWLQVNQLSASMLGVRNTVIGTLMVDIAEGVPLDKAVAKFEAKVAPTNYKRPTAVVTKAMIEKAKAEIEGLGLTSALERRYATINDITVNNILFADRSTPLKSSDNVFDSLMADADSKAPKSLDKIDEVTIDQFINHILPSAKSVEVMVENRHANNFVSLIAPADPTALGMFKWSNKFSWSYNGDFADSIKERVKQAGGSVVGDLCCRLAWEYRDDLDFHMTEPNDRIYYGHRNSVSGGHLDVDANGMNGIMEHPVENIYYPDASKMRNGIYILMVNNYNRRSSGVGFEVEVDIFGEMHSFAYDKVVSQSQTITVATFEVSRVKGLTEIKMKPELPSTTISKEAWGIKTGVFQRVDVIMNSPNFWDGQMGIGNKHYFFMLNGCKNSGQARGFYNEFLKQELDPHRKAMEMVGNKLKTVESEKQLSGVGFSSTQRNSLVCRVQGSFTRVVKVLF